MKAHARAAPRPASSAGHEAALFARAAEGTGSRDTIEVEFEAGADAAAGARNALLALEGRIDPQLLGDVRLLVSELVTNSVRHSDARAHDPVRMAVTVSDGTLRVEVADAGQGFVPQPRDADRTRPGGWGLVLVDQLADRWGVARDRLTRVWFEIDQSSPRVAA